MPTDLSDRATSHLFSHPTPPPLRHFAPANICFAPPSATSRCSSNHGATRRDDASSMSRWGGAGRMHGSSACRVCRPQRAAHWISPAWEYQKSADALTHPSAEDVGGRAIAEQVRDGPRGASGDGETRTERTGNWTATTGPAVVAAPGMPRAMRHDGGPRAQGGTCWISRLHGWKRMRARRQRRPVRTRQSAPLPSLMPISAASAGLTEDGRWDGAQTDTATASHSAPGRADMRSPP